MSEAPKKTFKQKLMHELSEYAINVIYLTLFFGAFAVARRLTLAHFNIEMPDYFVGIIKALVIGKVIMIGAFLRISKKFEDRPLLIPVFYKTALFVLWVILFDAAEGLIKGIINTGTFSAGADQLIHHHFNKMWLGGLIMITLSFIPFFALKEISRYMGHENFRNLLLKSQGSL